MPHDGAGAVLATAPVHASGLPDAWSGVLTTLTFPGGVPRSPGDVLAVVMVHVSGNTEEVAWAAQPSDAYAGGAFLFRAAGDGNVFEPSVLDRDAGFRTTMALP